MKTIRVALLTSLAAIAGCASQDPSQTLFRSNFDTSDVGAAPTGAQFRGTLAVVGDAGGAKVITPPDGSSGNWLQAGASQTGTVSGVEGRLAGQPAPGLFQFATLLDLPTGAGTGTIAFNAAQLAGEPASPSFLTLQFLPNNRVQINGNPASQFGGFTRNTPFRVLVTLDTAAARPTAHIILAGSGASGTADTTIADSALAQRFDSVALLGANKTLSFAATNIAVTRSTPSGAASDHPVAVTMRE
jgi:hypothetical protein